MNDTLQTALTILVYAIIALGLIGLVIVPVAWLRAGRVRNRHAEEFWARRDAAEEDPVRRRGAGRSKL